MFNLIILHRSFGREQYGYEGVVSSNVLLLGVVVIPLCINLQTPSSIQSFSDLGAPVTLLVRVDNTGPSTIQNAMLNVSFPSQVSPESTSRFFLYPSRVTGELLVCSW